MKILRCWCSNPTRGKLFAINLLFTTKQYKVDNIDNFVYYGKTRMSNNCGKYPLNSTWRMQDFLHVGDENLLFDKFFGWKLHENEIGPSGGSRL